MCISLMLLECNGVYCENELAVGIDEAMNNFESASKHHTHGA